MKSPCDINDILQICPNCPTNPMFSCCLLVVDEVKSWGVMGHVQSLGKDQRAGGQAYIRLPWAEIEPTGGKAVWVPSENEAA